MIKTLKVTVNVMTKELFIYSGIMVLSVLVSSASQILLKISTKKVYSSKIKEYLNPYVILGYTLFFGCTLISMYALKVVPLSMSPILESTGYIFVAALSYIFLKEKLSKRQFIGILLILVGIVVYSL